MIDIIFCTPLLFGGMTGWQVSYIISIAVIPETTKDRTDPNNGEVMIVPKQQVTKLNRCRLKFGKGLSIPKAQNSLFP